MNFRTLRRAIALLLLLRLTPAASAAEAARVVTLAEATESALRTHESVGAAAADMRRAEVASWRPWSAIAPSLDAAGSYTREKDEIAFPGTLAALGGINPLILQRDALRGAFTAEQPIVSPQFFALRDLADADRSGAAEALRAARQDVILAVSEAYYGVLRARALLVVAREAVALAELETTHAKAREAEGDVLRSDVLRAETEVERARQRVVEAEGAEVRARYRLARVAALEEPFDVADAPAPRVDLDSAEPFVSSALRQSPDVRRGERGAEAARAEERRQRSLLYPTLGVRFQYRLVDEETFAERSEFWDVIAGVRVPLWSSGGSQWIAWQEQKAKVQKAEVELQGLRHDVELRVREAFVTAKTLLTREELAAKEEALAIEGHRLLSESYREGVASSVDLLAALNARSAARTDRTLVAHDRSVAILRLERAAGMLGEAPPEPYQRVVVTDE